jgi:hypothetical protein
MYPPTDFPDPATLDTSLDGTAAKVRLPPRRRKRDRKFIPTLPETIFCRLVQLPRRSWAVYLVLLQRCRLNRTQSVVLSSCLLSRFGLSRNDKWRALPALEKAGLIRVERHPRRNPTITLLPPPE